MIPRISQEKLGEIIGASRETVNLFMNKFKKLGLIDYNGGLHVHRALVTVVLHE